jgi:hypothetical protein
MENYKYVLQFDFDTEYYVSKNLTRTPNLMDAYKFDSQLEAKNIAITFGFNKCKIIKFKIIYELVS